MSLLFSRPLLKLSGESLSGGGNGVKAEAVARTAEDIAEAVGMGCRMSVVVGGGNFFRGGRETGLAMERPQADGVGMLATCMNGVILRAALEAAGVRARVFSALAVGDLGGAAEAYGRRAALAWLEARGVAIFVGGTGHPYFSTDTAAVLRAAEMGCDALLKATKVDGVYAADPHGGGFRGGERYERVSYDEALERRLGFMDAAAVALARDVGLPILVFSFGEAGNLGKVLAGGGRHTLVGGE